MIKKAAKVGIIIGSKSDWPVVEKGLNAYKDLKLECSIKIASAHRTPVAVEEWVRNAEKNGTRVIIAVAGMAAALPGVVAAKTMLPVIGVPVESGALKGQDALYSMVQMPPGIPVACVGINGMKNALVLAAQIIALDDAVMQKRLRDFRRKQAEKVSQDDKSVQAIYKQIYKPEKRAKTPVETVEKCKPAEKNTVTPGKKKDRLAKTPVETSPGAFVSTEDLEEALSVKKITRLESSHKPEGKKPRFIYRVNPENPGFDIIEKAADTILDGGVIAIPTDTVYGLACDSTNVNAVKKLYELKGRDFDKPIPVLIDNMRTLGRLIRNIPDDVKVMLDELWPGALTVVFPKPEETLSAVSPGPSIGVRVPDNMVALAVISMVARPLAVTSANPSGQPPATNATDTAGYFGKNIQMIIDAGESPGANVSTVLSVLQEPYNILREGVFTFEQLKLHLDKLGR
mgnify:CR=1 FL=1